MVARAPLSIVDRDSVTVDNTVLNPVPVTPTGTVNVRVLNQLIPVEFDDIVLDYTDGNLTQATYKLGGVVVAILGLTYVDGNLTRVTRL